MYNQIFIKRIKIIFLLVDSIFIYCNEKHTKILWQILLLKFPLAVSPILYATKSSMVIC